MMFNYKKLLFLLILITTIIKLTIAGVIELSNDEVYYWTYALKLDWNYFDHPPMVGWLIRLTTVNLLWVNEIFMRLGAIIGCAVTSIVIFNIGKLIDGEKTGWYAAIIYNTSIYTSIITGLLILPDAPQMLFWVYALYIMCQLVIQTKTNPNKLLLLGLIIGLAILCKIHALYLWVGFGIFVLLTRKQWLRYWQLYAAIGITIICIIPIIYWNMLYDFITYRFHSERVAHTTIQWGMFGREIIGEIAYQNPIIFILVISALVYFLKKKIYFASKDIFIWIICMSIPMILLFWGISVFNPTLPHWTGPAYIPLFFLVAKRLGIKTNKIYPVTLKIATGVLGIALLVSILLIKLAPFNLGSKANNNFGEGCPTLDLSGWEDFSYTFNQLVKEDRLAGKIKSNTYIIINNWFPGGHLEFYTSRISGLPVIGIGALNNLHQFAWLNQQRKTLQLGDDAYSIVPSNLPLNPIEVYGKYFELIQYSIDIPQIRNGKIVRIFKVYRLKNCIEIPLTKAF